MVKPHEGGPNGCRDTTTAASLIGAFGASTLSFRIQRELGARGDGDITWIPWADGLMFVATVASFAVVALLLAGQREPCVNRWSAGTLAASAVLAASYPPAILAHYRLLGGKGRQGPRANPEPLERWITIVAGFLAVGVAVLAYRSA